MNWEHLKTYIWVRWRLSANQVRRSGTVGVIIAAILAGLRILGGAITFIAGLLVGIFALGQVQPTVLIFVWDGVAGAFIVFWLVGLMSELQRTELLSLDNFMHLPVSPAGAFLMNYLGSSIGISLILFLPAMVGLSLGLTFSRGFAMLSLFLLVATFFLMVTAITHQFRGWLAGMMANPRRRRTVIAIVSVAFILVFQLPNLLTRPGLREKQQAERIVAQKSAGLKKEYDEGQISPEEYKRQLDTIQKAGNADDEREFERVSGIVRIVNMAAPPGWLPYGVAAAAEGRYFPVLACIVGMGLVGTASLRRSYRTTIRLYTGDFTKGRAGRKIKPETVFKDASDSQIESSPSSAFLEKRLPCVSEHASAITLMNFRSMIRAPEVKMLLLTPVILLIVFGGMLASKESEVSGLARPLIAMGFAAFILIIGMTGYLRNQFGFDRSGFRTFVLSCAPRRDILLGKNLSLLPFAIVLMILFVGVYRWINPMRWDYVAAVLIQTLPMYLLFCITGNVLSILSPMTLKPGSGMPASHQGVGALFNIVFMVVVPVPMSFTLVPLGIEALYISFSSDAWFPVFMVLSLIEVPVVIWLYRTVINWQGILLQQNEKKILDVVSAKGE